MEVNKKDIIEINGKMYIVIVTFEDNYKNYAFLNELEDDEKVTNNYYLAEVNESLIIIRDENLLNSLFPKIEKLIREELNNI